MSRRPARLLPCLLGLLVAFACAADDATTSGQASERARDAQARDAEQKLAALRAQIAELAAAQDALLGERDSAARALREADRKVAEADAALRATEADLSAQQARLDELAAREAELAAGLAQQREALAALLRALHAQGRHAPLKLLLAQDRIEALGRHLAYLGYFRRDRAGRIERLLADLDALDQARADVRAQQAVLEAARAAQQADIATLAAERGQRRQLLAELEGRFRDTRSRLTALGRDETALIALLERLRDLFADIPLQIDATAPFASRAGNLPWPLPGKLRTGFGRPLPDGRPSSGWLLEAQPGQEVRAVAHGRVAFADWLKGFGLIAIVDHGDGYMSLYANNDALLRAAGDWVGAGETIAIAGTSGGSAGPSLYFELRRNGRPVDPVRWLRRHP